MDVPDKPEAAREILGDLYDRLWKPIDQALPPGVETVALFGDPDFGLQQNSDQTDRLAGPFVLSFQGRPEGW